MAGPLVVIRDLPLASVALLSQNVQALNVLWGARSGLGVGGLRGRGLCWQRGLNLPPNGVGKA